MMITSILNQQTKHPINLPRLQKLTDWLGLKLEKMTAPQEWAEVCIALVNDDGITQPNLEYFGKNHPTDVISFRYNPVPGEKQAYSGDLMINVERALQEGTARGKPDYELALYIAHGFDHLSGAEDDTEEKQKKMRATETSWLVEADKAGLINGLFE